MIKKRWRYKKDIFGRKHREYFLENVFGADLWDMKTFRALKKKLSRDYLAFFGGLNKVYQKGEFKSIAKESIVLINQTIILMDHIVDFGTMDKKDVDQIVENVNLLNDRRDFLVQKSDEVQALKDKLSTIQETTGVSPESLNITEKIVRGGARAETRRRREGPARFIKRAMPGTYGMAAETLKGLGAAALGPFALPVGRFAKDIFGLGRELSQKYRMRKEERLGRALAPLSSGLPTEGFGRIGRHRETGADIGQAVRAQRRGGSEVLLDFFNRGAYKAKWTKELLKKIKDVGKKGEEGIGGLAGSLMDSFKSLGSAIGPLIAGAGSFVALAAGIGGVVFSLYEFQKLLKAFFGFEKAKKAAREAGERAGAAAEQKLEAVKKVGLEEYAGAAGKTPKAVLQDIAGLEQRKELAQKFHDPWYKQVPRRMAQAYGIKARPEIMSVAKRTEELEKEFRGISKSPTTPADVSKQVELLRAINKLDESVLGLSRNVEKAQPSPTTTFREPGIGNPFDTSDPFSRALAGSELELED